MLQHTALSAMDASVAIVHDIWYFLQGSDAFNYAIIQGLPLPEDNLDDVTSPKQLFTGGIEDSIDPTETLLNLQLVLAIAPRTSLKVSHLLLIKN